ncbi:hypothetical protein ACWGK1_05950 [Streptomyces wedmorensis]
MQQRLRRAQAPSTGGPGRLRALWRAAHEPVPAVSRRVRLLAYGRRRLRARDASGTTR